MALEIFLRIDGVTGSSRNYHHKGWSDVVSWEWSLNQSTPGADGARPPARMHEISIVKMIGMDGPGVMQLLAEGTQVESAAVSVVPVVGKRDAQQKYLTMTFNRVRVASLSIGGSDADNAFRETLKLQFEQVTYEYNEYAAVGSDGKPTDATAYNFGWDMNANVAC
jgi:type VI secretion system secreted protein Hcp